MIGQLTGELVYKRPPSLMLDVNGVGYEIEAPMSTFYHLPDTGKRLRLFTHLIVRDDAHVLFGFYEEAERLMFRLLLKVNGVGAKMALAILSGMSADEFCQCVESENTAALVRLPGIGKKTAQRLIIEMRDRLEQLSPGVSDDRGVPVMAAKPDRPVSAVEDAVSALVALGYKPADASRMVRGVETTDKGSDDIIRMALKQSIHKS